MLPYTLPLKYSFNFHAFSFQPANRNRKPRIPTVQNKYSQVSRVLRYVLNDFFCWCCCTPKWTELLLPQIDNCTMCPAPEHYSNYIPFYLSPDIAGAISTALYIECAVKQLATCLWESKEVCMAFAFNDNDIYKKKNNESKLWFLQHCYFQTHLWPSSDIQIRLSS